MHVLVMLLLMIVISARAFDDLVFPNSDDTTVEKMKQQGELQYKERGRLPKYGTCWRQAVEHIEESCRALSEETQSDVALHITNCFLAMSGHETYNCGSDKKPNVRGICISSMTDRAFNVYTEFYTHTQNICWFLRGQLWQEAIAANTAKVGKQLDMSAANQEALLLHQRESLAIQERLMQYGGDLEQMFGALASTTAQHEDVIRVLTTTVANLQSWLIGEISWVDSVVFYVLAALAIVCLSSTSRTIAARLPMLLLLSMNFFIERLLCHRLSAAQSIDARKTHAAYYAYVWLVRYAFIAIAFAIFVLTCYSYKDYLVANNALLENLHEEVHQLSKTIENQGLSRNDGVASFQRISPPDSIRMLSNKEEISPERPLVRTCRYNLRRKPAFPF